MVEPSPDPSPILHLYADGASRHNPGPAAYAWIVVDPKKDEDLARGSGFIGSVTNSVAEYTAVIKGLQACIDLGHRRVRVHSDSQFCMRQIRGEYKVNAEHLKPLYDEVAHLIHEFEWTDFVWLRRVDKWISECDRMANEVLDDHEDSG